MEARSQSEARQDLDSKLTPIRYDEIRDTAGESNARQQINVPTVNKHYFKPSFSALDYGINSEFHPCSTSTSEGNKDSEERDDSFNYPSEVFDDNTDQVEHDDDTEDYTLTHLGTDRNAPSLLHSEASDVNYLSSENVWKKTQRAILTTTPKAKKIAKRNLSDHAILPPCPKPTKDATFTSRSFQLSQMQQIHRPSVTTTQRPHFTPAPNRYGSK